MTTRLILCLLSALLLTGCDREPTAPEIDPGQVAAILASLQASGGVAAIGFKESGAARGVDARGQRLVSSETVAQMKQRLREWGIEVTYEFQTIPAVTVRVPIDSAIVAKLLAHPNIDYFEVGRPGQRS